MNHDLLRLAHEYLESIGRTDELGGLRFFADDVVQVEFPNRLLPNGATRDLAALDRHARRAPRQHPCGRTDARTLRQHNYDCFDPW